MLPSQSTLTLPLTVLLIISLLVSPAGAQTTRPASTRTEMEALAQQLLSPDPKARDAAMATLLSMGPVAVPILDEFIDRLTAVEKLLLANASDSPLSATLVTLTLRDAPISDACWELSQKVGFRISVPPAAMLARVSIDADAQPFWVVLQRVCASAGLAVKSINKDSIQLVPIAEGGISIGTAPSARSGGFLMVLTSAEKPPKQPPSGRPDPSPWHEVELKFTLLAEPKMQSLLGGHPIIEELTLDGTGEVLITSPRRADPPAPLRKVSNTWPMAIRFGSRIRSKTLSQLRGTIPLSMQGVPTPLEFSLPFLFTDLPLP